MIRHHEKKGTHKWKNLFDTKVSKEIKVHLPLLCGIKAASAKQREKIMTWSTIRKQRDRQTRHHRYRGTETERQIHICIQREKSKMSERQRILRIWAYMALFTTSNCDPSDIYPLTRTFLLSLPKYSPTDNWVLKCQRFVKHLIQSITGVFFNEWHYRAILCRHRNQQLCKSVGLFKFLWNSNSLSVGMR